MFRSSLPNMSQAFKLTRSGQLSKATAVLLAALSTPAMAGEPATASAKDSGQSAIYQGWSDFMNKAQAQTEAFSQGFQPQKKTPAREDIVPNGGAFLAKSFRNAAGMRPYKLYIPSIATSKSRPLIIMLHGCTQNADDFAAGTRMNILAEQHNFLVAYPEQIGSANPNSCWNWFAPENQQAGRGEASLIAGITQQIMKDYAVDTSRVYVAGLSAGGAAAAIMGQTYPDLYAAIGVHSGLPCGAARDLPSAMAAMKQGNTATSCQANTHIVPTIVFHGVADKTVNPNNSETIIKQAEASNGAQLKMTEQPGQRPGGRAYNRKVYTDANGQVQLEQWLIQGAGHAWAGGSKSGSYTDPQGPDASREMVRFFLAHSLI